MLISYYANKNSSPRLPSWQPSLIFFNIPIESGSIIKPWTLKHFQVAYRLHKAGYWTTCPVWINSLTPGRFQFHFRKVIFKLTLVNDGRGISYEIALRWMPQDLTDDESTLVQVMAWCRQASSHYLSQCWPRSMSPNGVTRPQWVNSESSPHWIKLGWSS